jgi:hypothetical protein
MLNVELQSDYVTENIKVEDSFGFAEVSYLKELCRAILQ